MAPKVVTFLIPILTLGLISCNRAKPAGFWKNYRPNLIIAENSDQGPHGGHMSVCWKTSGIEIFDSKSILGFADKNGWTIVDSLEFSQEQTIKWRHNEKSIFPLTFKGFSDSLTNDATLDNFPRWFGGNVKLYRFKTGWVTIEPGTDNSIEENGFILINGDNTQFAIYHLWGD